MPARFDEVFPGSFWGVFGVFSAPADIPAILCEKSSFQGGDRGVFGMFSTSFRGVSGVFSALPDWA
jgi:hypothetical protein